MNPLRRFVIHLTLGTSLLGGLMFEGPPVLSAATFTCTAGDVGCLIASMGKANVSPDHDYILLQPGTYLLTKPDNTPPNDLPNGLPVNTGALTIVGVGGQGQTLIARAESAPGFRLLQNAPTGGLTIAGVTLANGDTVVRTFARYGGCIYNSGSMILWHSTVRECAAWMGGGIYSLGDLRIESSVIVENNGYVFCGGMVAYGPTVIERTWIGDNWAEDTGGICGGRSLTIRQSVIDNNYASESDGGGMVGGSGTEITQSLISNNNARRGGGGLTLLGNDTGQPTIAQSTIWGNRSEEAGAGIRVGTGEVHLTGVAVLFNRSTRLRSGPTEGGGVAVAPGATAVVARSWLLWNEADSHPDCSGNVELEGWNVIGDAGRFHPQDEAPCQ